MFTVYCGNHNDRIDKHMTPHHTILWVELGASHLINCKIVNKHVMASIYLSLQFMLSQWTVTFLSHCSRDVHMIAGYLVSELHLHGWKNLI